MLSNHTIDLMTAAKAKPNGEWRNKAISHLKDALAAFKMMELDEETAMATKRAERPANGQLAGPTVPWHEDELTLSSSVCTCGPGYVDNDCPVHGGIVPDGKLY